MRVKSNLIQVCFVLALMLGLTLFNACKKGFDGTAKEIDLPETFMVVDSIYRSGSNRLPTKVEAHWWGSSANGIIKYYEVSLDKGNTWFPTQSQDSIFLLEIPAGTDSVDAVVLVRAVDQLGQKDPSPASTLFPIKNSAPTASFVYAVFQSGIATRNIENTFPVLKFSITGIDPDGDQINAFEVYINDTNRSPVLIPGNATAFTLVSQQPKADSATCDLYLGNATQKFTESISGLKQGAFNTIYIRAVDKAFSKSAFIASRTVWVKKVSSDVLLVNAYNNSKLLVQNFYCKRLNAVGINTFDTLQASEIINDNYTQLQPDFLTQSRTFSLFKKIVWFSDDAESSLSMGQRTTGPFFDAGGKLFMAVTFTSSYNVFSNYLDWTPIKSLVNAPTGSVFRITLNTDIPAVKADWPKLNSTQVISSARPFTLPDNNGDIAYDSLYADGIIESKAAPQPSADWIGGSITIARRYKPSTQKSNFIISSIPLERMNGKSNADSLFQKIFIEQLEF
jgi:hypothetical protein